MRNFFTIAIVVLFATFGVSWLQTEMAIAQVKTSTSFPLMAGRFERVSSEFSLARINPVTGVNQSHSGIDLVSKDFGAPVLAWADGKVVDTVQSESGCGWEVWIQHRKGWDSRYCHLSGINVKPGQMVQAGQKIASVGSTGNSTGEHLHFEVRLQSQLLDPRRVFKAQSVQGG